MNPLSAATATGLAAVPLEVIVAGTLLLAAVAYVVSCGLWPLARCRWCAGSGRRSRADGRVWRPCRWCKGGGRRWRWGRRFWSYWRRQQI